MEPKMNFEKLERWRRFLSEVLGEKGDEWILSLGDLDELESLNDLENYGLDMDEDVELVVRLKHEDST